MYILSIDASSKSSGFSVFNDNDLIEYKCETSSSTDVIKRIKKMTSALSSLLEKQPIEIIVLEEVRTDGFHAKPTVWKALAYLQASFVFLVQEKQPKIKIEYLQPSSWRSKCGIKTGAGIKRDSLKQADIAFAKETFNITENINDDVADSICIGYAYIKGLRLNSSEKTNWT